MRAHFVFGTSLALAAVVPFVACGSTEPESTFDAGTPPTPSTGPTTPPLPVTDGGGSEGGVAGGELVISSLRIDPPDAVRAVVAGQKVTQAYRVLGKIKDRDEELDLTPRFVFYVPDNYLVGGFPLDGSATFTSRLPTAPTDPPQRGGKVTVRAQARNTDDSLVTVTTSLTLKLTVPPITSPNATPALPANPGALFGGAVDAARAPTLAYPNNGTMLPPNLRRLEVHWQPGSATNTLYEVSFKSPSAEITYYSRCGALGATWKPDSCAFELDETGYRYLSDSNRGETAKLRIRATDDTGTGVGESATFDVSFAEANVEGGLYYWKVIPPTNPELSNGSGEVLRFDFGGTASAPEPFLVPGQNGLAQDQCVGCHALSRDGKKLVASVGGRWDGRQVLINDLSRPVGSAGWLTQGGGTTGAPAQNRIQFASFNPDGTRIVAVYGDRGNVGRDAFRPTEDALLPVGSMVPTDLGFRKLFLMDGSTGIRNGTIDLPYKPDHPDWSPDGKSIAVTRVNDEATTSQEPANTGIEVIKSDGAGGWLPSETVIAPGGGANRFAPSFVPDSSFLLYTEATCPGGDLQSIECDANADPTAKTWATKPDRNATPILLAKAAQPGVADNGATALADTLPKTSPFQTKQGAGKLFWYTVASRREPGLRKRTGAGQQLLWMFAIDPAKVLAGQDGSYTGFYLPFQDLQTSNHIGQWTQKIVSDQPPPPPPSPPPPPPPPVPPVPR